MKKNLLTQCLAHSRHFKKNLQGLLTCLPLLSSWISSVISLSSLCKQSGWWLLGKGKINPTWGSLCPILQISWDLQSSGGQYQSYQGALTLLTDLFACKPRWSATSLEGVEAPASFCLQVSGHTCPLRHWLPSWTASPAPQRSTWLLLLSHSPTRMQDLGAAALPG